jgi:hypothetical protein
VIIYQPRDGYVGNDVFVVETFIPQDNGGVPRRTLAVSATVQRDPVRIASSPPAPSAAGSAPPSTPPAACRYLANGGFSEQTRYGQGTMIMAPNTSCSVQTTGIVISEVDTPPSHGRVNVGGATYTYIPNRDYIGPDRFSVVYNMTGHRVINVVDVQISR